jgi:hypothetical protein
VLSNLIGIRSVREMDRVEQRSLLLTTEWARPRSIPRDDAEEGARKKAFENQPASPSALQEVERDVVAFTERMNQQQFGMCARDCCQLVGR